jgi:hypothetical protein
MQAALAHALMLTFAAVLSRLGWFMAHNPERALRFFTFGTEPILGRRFGTAWCRIVGWVFTWGSGFGVVLYLILIPFDILHPR